MNPFSSPTAHAYGIKLAIAALVVLLHLGIWLLINAANRHSMPLTQPDAITIQISWIDAESLPEDAAWAATTPSAQPLRDTPAASSSVNTPQTRATNRQDTPTPSTADTREKPMAFDTPTSQAHNARRASAPSEAETGGAPPASPGIRNAPLDLSLPKYTPGAAASNPLRARENLRNPGDIRVANAVKQAQRPDCRTAHANAGLLAIPQLLASLVTDDICQW